MLQMTLWEKITTIFNTVKESYFLIFLFVFTILLGFVLYDTYRQRKSSILKICSIVYIIIFIALIIKYNNSLLSLLDYLMNNLASIFYFPNLATYILLIIVSNIMMIFTITNKKISRFNKIINIICYCIITFLMFVTFDYILKKHINVYNYKELFTDTTLLAVLQLTTAIFLIWIIIKLIVKIYIKLRKKDKIEIIIDDSKYCLLQEENKNLNMENDRLYNEITILKEELLHKNDKITLMSKEIENDFTQEEYDLLYNLLSYIKKKKDQN